MKSACLKTLIVGLLVSGLFADCGSLFAAQKLQPIMNGGAEMQHDLSTNEALLMQFQNEKEALLRDKSKDNAPHLLKNKIKILDAKITFLQSELKHTKPVRAEIKKAPVTAVQQAPLAVSWRPYAKPEARHRIFLAVTQNKVRPQPVQKPALRQEPSSVAVTPAKKVEPQPIQKQASRQEASMQVLPKKVRMQPSASAERENPMARAVPQKVEVPVTARIAVPGQKTAKTGRDWKNMTKAEKDIYVLSIMGNLGRRNVFLEKSYDFYIRSIDDKLRDDPSLEKEYVHKILITSAYENEPESRQGIDNIGT